MTVYIVLTQKSDYDGFPVGRAEISGVYSTESKAIAVADRLESHGYYTTVIEQGVTE